MQLQMWISNTQNSIYQRKSNLTPVECVRKMHRDNDTNHKVGKYDFNPEQCNYSLKLRGFFSAFD